MEVTEFFITCFGFVAIEIGFLDLRDYKHLTI